MIVARLIRRTRPEQANEVGGNRQTGRHNENVLLLFGYS